MRDTNINVNGYCSIEHLVEFDSLKEFNDYICNTPLNETFRWEELASVKSNASWTGSSSYEQACDLLKNGWTESAKELTKKLKITEMQKEVSTKAQNILSVCGYQAIVPLYLNGVPTNMVNKRMVPCKQKVITINKALCVSGSISAEKMKEEAIKSFQIIKKIESSGMRVNLNLLISSGHAAVKIRLKSAGEKLNISKLAFPLVHPSMLRRLYFRFVETYPTMPKSMRGGYGRVPNESDFKKLCGDKEILLPTLLRSGEDEIKELSVDDLISRLK